LLAYNVLKAQLHDKDSTILNCSASNYESMPSYNKKNDRISKTSSRNTKNKVEAQPRNVNKKNYVVEPIHNVDDKQSQLNVNSELICATYIPSSSSLIMKGCPDCSLVSGLWMFKTHDMDPLSAHELCKSKKSSHQPKVEDTNHEKLYILHMDLCGSMRMASINGKSSGLGLQCMTLVTSSSGLTPYLVSQQPCIPPSRDDWDHLFQPMVDEYFNPPTFLSLHIPSTLEQEHSPCISQGFEESPKTPTFHDDPLNESLHEDSTSQGSSSNILQIHTPFEHLGRWTKDHPIANVIRDPSRSIFIRKEVQTNAMWCFFDAFLTLVEPKNFKQVRTKPLWIDAMQEEIHEFKRLQVWELVSCPDKVFLIMLKWIYKVKTDEFDGVLKNKARLVAQKFRHEEEGSLMYLISSRPNLTYAVCLCARYQAKPNKKHLKAVKRIFQYLKGTINMGLWYSKDTGMSLTAYADADHARCQDTRRSTLGNAQSLGDKLVSWSSKKQRAPQSQVQRLNIFPYLGVVLKSANHINVRYHFMKEQVENGIVEIYFVQTEYQLADIFTKPLPRERFNFLIEMLGMRSTSSETLKRLAEEMDE
nr:copia protein [Tanacetum cinerariifolium]